MATSTRRTSKRPGHAKKLSKGKKGYSSKSTDIADISTENLDIFSTDLLVAEAANNRPQSPDPLDSSSTSSTSTSSATSSSPSGAEGTPIKSLSRSRGDPSPDPSKSSDSEPAPTKKSSSSSSLAQLAPSSSSSKSATASPAKNSFKSSKSSSSESGERNSLASGSSSSLSGGASSSSLSSAGSSAPSLSSSTGPTTSGSSPSTSASSLSVPLSPSPSPAPAARSHGEGHHGGRKKHRKKSGDTGRSKGGKTRDDSSAKSAAAAATAIKEEGASHDEEAGSSEGEKPKTTEQAVAKQGGEGPGSDADSIGALTRGSIWESRIVTRASLFKLGKKTREEFFQQEESLQQQVPLDVQGELDRFASLQSLYREVQRVSSLSTIAIQKLEASFGQMATVMERHASSLEHLLSTNSTADSFSSPLLPNLMRSISTFSRASPLIHQRFESSLFISSTPSSSSLLSPSSSPSSSSSPPPSSSSSSSSSPSTLTLSSSLSSPILDENNLPSLLEMGQISQRMFEYWLKKENNTALEYHSGLKERNNLLSKGLENWASSHLRASLDAARQFEPQVNKLTDEGSKFAQSRTKAPTNRRVIPIVKLQLSSLNFSPSSTPTTSDESESLPRVGSFIRRKPSLNRDQSAIRLGFVERSEKKPAFQELVQREKDYIYQLITLVRIFLQPLRARINSAKGLEGLTLADTEVIFGNIEQLYRTHELSLRSLERCVRDWKSSAPGSVFYGMCRGLEVYRTYLSNLFFSEDRLTICTAQNRSLREFIKQQENSIPATAAEAVSLQNSLHAPIAHLRYLHSFSQRMTKLVGQRDTDFQYFRRSKKIIKGILLEVQAQKQKPLEVIELLELRDRLVGWTGAPILTPGRKFHRMYEFAAVTDEKVSPKQLLYLCSDILIVTHKKGKKTEKLMFDYAGAPKDLTLASLPDSVSQRHCFAITFPSVGIKSFVAKSQDEKEQFFSDILYTSGISRVFGKPLDSFTQQEIEGVPNVVHVICTFLRKDGALRTVGIFRENGNQNQITGLREAFDRSNFAVPPGTNPHNMAGLLKLWLRLLPEPVCTFAFYDPLTSAMALPEPVPALRDLLKQLPMQNYQLLKYLMAFLAECQALADVNKMSAHNLSIVFAPAILTKPAAPEDDPFSLPEKAIFDFVSLLITKHSLIFS